MRGSLVVVVLLLGTVSLGAAPLDLGGNKPAAPLPAADAERFAIQLFTVVDQVARNYVRPVSRSKLLVAALSGLYEEVPATVPAGWPARFEKALKDSGYEDETEIKQVAGFEPPNLPPPTPNHQPPIIKLIAELRQQLGDRETLRNSAGLRVAVQGMARALDPYSKPVDGVELRKSNGEDLSSGVGLELAADAVDGPWPIKNVVLGGPAQRAGIKPGDRITHVDGKPAGANTRALLTVVERLNADSIKGTRKLELTVQPASGKPALKVALELNYFKPETILGVRREGDESWNCLLDAERKIAYIRLASLEHGSAEDLQGVLADLQRDGMRGLILDLRWCPGGFLNEAVLAARTFIPEGLIATVKSRNRADDQVYRSQADIGFSKFPMVVLINNETSGGAELIAAALQDAKRALIAGQRSFGKASVQTMVALPVENSGLKLTTGNFIRPSGKALHRFPDSRPSDDWGVRPERHLELPIDADLSKQLKDWALLQALRPSKSNEVLPLDDPDNDPQRQAALRELVKRLK